MPIRALERKKDPKQILRMFFLTVAVSGILLFGYQKAKNIKISIPEVLGQMNSLAQSAIRSVQQSKTTKNIEKEAQKSATQVLGIAESTLRQTASSSASRVESYVIGTIGETLYQQFQKLPSREQDILKEHICK